MQRGSVIRAFYKPEVEIQPAPRAYGWVDAERSKILGRQTVCLN